MDDGELEFQKIYATFQPKILRYVTHLVGEHEAEDLTQEVFAKIAQTLGTFRGESQLSTWIYRIATNAAIDKLRTSSFRQAGLVSSLDDCDEVEEQAIWQAEELLSPEQRLMRKEMHQCFGRYVGNLPANYRAVVVLSELEAIVQQRDCRHPRPEPGRGQNQAASRTDTALPRTQNSLPR